MSRRSLTCRISQIEPIGCIGHVPAVGADTLHLHGQHGVRLFIGCVVTRKGSGRRVDDMLNRKTPANGIDDRLALHPTVGQRLVTLITDTEARVTRNDFVEVIDSTMFTRTSQITADLGRFVVRIHVRIVPRCREAAGCISARSCRTGTRSRGHHQRTQFRIDIATVPTYELNHPCLHATIAGHELLGLIIEQFIVGHTVGRRNALPLPRHAVEVDRERAQTVDVDFGPCGQRCLGRCDLGDRPSRRQHVAGIGGRAAVLVDAHGIRPVGREIGLGRIDSLLLLGHLQRRIDRLVTGHRRAVEIVVIVHTQLHDGDLGRRLARVGRADMDGEDRRAVVALRGPLRSPQHHAACPFVAPREPLAGIRLAVGHRVVVDVAHVGRVVDRRLAAGRGILDARLGQFADDLGVGLQPRLRNGKGLDGAVLGRHGQHARTAVLRVGRRHDLHGPHPRRRHGARPRIGERFVDDGLADRGPRHVALGAPRVAALLEGHHLHDTHIGHLAVDGRAVGREPDFGGRQGDAGSRIDAQFPGILVTSRKERRRRQERYDSCFHLL